MAGHSHWSKIKYKKQAADAKKGQIFSKLVREIMIAAREGGENLDTNARLRLAVENAKKFNLPKENIERAIKRGVGKLEGEKFEEVFFEALGPGGSAILICGITDNKNRALNEARYVLNKHGGKLVAENSIKWMFRKLGCITVNLKDQQNLKKENLEILAIEAGAEDIYWEKEKLDIYTKIEDLEKVKNYLIEKGVKIDEVSIDFVPKEMIELEENEREKNEKLFEELDELEFVQNIFTNLKL